MYNFEKRIKRNLENLIHDVKDKRIWSIHINENKKELETEKV